MVYCMASKYWNALHWGVNTCYVIIAVTQQIRLTLSRQVKYTKFDNPLAHINNCVRLNIPKRLHNLSRQHAFWVSHYRKVPRHDISKYYGVFGCSIRSFYIRLSRRASNPTQLVRSHEAVQNQTTSTTQHNSRNPKLLTNSMQLAWSTSYNRSYWSLLTSN